MALSIWFLNQRASFSSSQSMQRRQGSDSSRSCSASAVVCTRDRDQEGTIGGIVRFQMEAVLNCIELQLATLHKSTPAGDGRLHESKLDGYRMLCRIDGGKVRLITRGQLDWTNRLAGADSQGDACVKPTPKNVRIPPSIRRAFWPPSPPHRPIPRKRMGIRCGESGPKNV